MRVASPTIGGPGAANESTEVRALDPSVPPEKTATPPEREVGLPPRAPVLAPPNPSHGGIAGGLPIGPWSAGAKKTSSMLVELDDGVVPATIAREVRRRLEAIGYTGDEILMRAFGYDRERIDRIITTGNDRDSASATYDEGARFCVGNDADPKVRRAAGIRPDQLTYCVRLRWKDDPMTVVWGGQRPGTYPEVEKTLEGWYAPEGVPKPKWDGVRSIAFYDPTKVELAPGAEVEYWFRSPAKDALVLVLAASRAHWEAAAGSSTTAYIFDGTKRRSLL